jgi:hypothetical protein
VHLLNFIQGCYVITDLDDVAQVHVALVQLLESRLIGRRTRRCAENLKVEIEAELAERDLVIGFPRQNEVSALRQHHFRAVLYINVV